MNSHADLELRNPLILALDVDTAEECFHLASQLGGKVGAFKVGPRLVVRYGADLISRLARTAPVFVDCKYLDIPSTMEAAVRASFDAGASLATVHAWAGPEALELLAKTERELCAQRPFKILCVTILTSFTEATLPPRLEKAPIASHVESLADLVFRAGLKGLVCSPQEASALRAKDPRAFLVTPGVRLPTDARGDQKRVETPEAAIRNGATALVVGRPIYGAADPLDACERVLASIQAGRA